MPSRSFEIFRICACIVMLTLLVASSSCTSPTARFHADARARGFSARSEPAPGPGSLVVFEKPYATDAGAVRFYLDGDGKPWLTSRRVASDPTSRDRLILRLMAQDPGTAILVGRPCYYQSNPACDATAWTAQRYDAQTVALLAAQINREISRFPDASITLVGYSGGGALAMLIAPALERLDSIVTIAANLDVAAWTEHHKHSPLTGSLDPALAPSLPATIRQTHFFGAKDDNVPVALMRAVADRQSNATVTVIPEYGHTCCWEKTWAAHLRAALKSDG